ncbi:MAG: hypothetical protein ABJA94_09185 [Rhodoglobus sp.]
MRVLLKLILDCPPDAAWNAIRSPDVFRAVSFPLSTFTSLEPGGFPEQWAAGEHPVLVKALGLVAVGEQVIDISFPPTRNGVRRVVDRGRGFPGITKWEHTMAVSAAPGDRTLYRDQLKFDGPLVLWPLFWAFWQWRAIGLTRLAPAFH